MTPQEEIQVRQMIANQMSAPRQPMFRAQMPDMDPTPRMTIATPEAEQAEYRRQRQALENAARFSGLLGNTPTPNPTTNYRSPYSREEIERLMRDEEAQRLGLRPPTDAERARLDANSQVNPEMPLNDLARARLDAERAAMDGSLPMLPPPIPPVGGEVAADPEPEEYDGFVDSGTGQRGYLDFKYMPTPMDTSVAMAQAAPVAMAQAAPPVASTAYNAPPVASTAYMPPPTAAPVNTAYMPPPTAAPVNTAYMPSRRTVPVDTTYRPPASANTTYMPSSSPSYGMSTTPTYNMSTSTTPTYGTSNRGQMREPSYSPNQAGKYKVDGPRLRNTGGLFNDLNAFFGRPQT